MTDKEAPVSNDVTLTKETCFALFAYDIGPSINLTEAERRILAGVERGRAVRTVQSKIGSMRNERF